jgi:lysozyme
VTIQDLITKHEGTRSFPYTDTVGKITIGVGRNLSYNGLRADEIALLLQNDIEAATANCKASFPWFGKLDDVRQAVLVDMAFNIGIGSLSGFHETLQAVEAGQYEAAANLMLQSFWASQVPIRALEDATMMRNGEWPTGVSNA